MSYYLPVHSLSPHTNSFLPFPCCLSRFPSSVAHSSLILHLSLFIVSRFPLLSSCHLSFFLSTGSSFVYFNLILFIPLLFTSHFSFFPFILYHFSYLFFSRTIFLSSFLNSSVTYPSFISFQCCLPFLHFLFIFRLFPECFPLSVFPSHSFPSHVFCSTSPHFSIHFTHLL